MRHVIDPLKAWRAMSAKDFLDMKNQMDETLTGVCRNCFQLKESHAEGKCLFETTLFEALTAKELFKMDDDLLKQWKETNKALVV